MLQVTFIYFLKELFIKLVFLCAGLVNRQLSILAYCQPGHVDNQGMLSTGAYSQLGHVVIGEY